MHLFFGSSSLFSLFKSKNECMYIIVFNIHIEQYYYTIIAIIIQT